MRKSSMFYGVLLSMMMSVAAASEGVAQQKEIQTVAESMAQKISKAGKTSIAVVDFTDLDGNVTQLGRYIAEQMSVALLNAADNFEVVDRTHLKTLLKEHKLSDSGVLDPATVTKLGQIAGIQALITGTLTPFGDSVELAVKVLDVNTAQMIGATNANIPKTEAIKKLLDMQINVTDPPKPTPTQSAKTTPTGPKVEVRGFTFELQGCKKANDTVTCHYVITSNGQDRELQVWGKSDHCSKFFDEFGNDYVATQATLANRTDDYGVKTLLIMDVRTKATLTFEKVSAETTMMKLHRLCVYDTERFQVQFRDVPMLK